MTVTVRPVPKRTYQNGIRPFRPVVPTNNIRPYTLKTWRPPVPEPLPPAPLLGPKELLGLGALVLAQFWGLFSSKPKKVDPNVSLFDVREGLGSYAVTTTYITEASSLVRCSDGAVIGGPSTTSSTTTLTYSSTYGITFGPGLAIRRNFCGSGTGSVTSGGLGEFRTIDSAGNVSTPTYRVSPVESGDSYNHTNSRTFTRKVLLDSITKNGVDVTPYVAQSRDYVPELEPLPQIPVIPSIPKAPPTTLPPEVEPLPEFEPQPATPGPAAPPATAPLVPRRTVPLPLPGATPTKDGAIVPQAPATVAVTPPDAHFPVPGAPPVTGNGPRPTPEGIAQELGRLEQKLARLSDPGPEGPGDGSDRLQLISDLIGRLIEFATSMTAGGGYGLSSPCEVDENGERIVTTVNYPGATNSLGVLSNKVDALAALIQVHKDLKQPNCKQAPAVGQPVTVNFVQVD